MGLVAYHSTTRRLATAIARSGFRVPSELAHSRTDAAVGDFFPAVFFARRPDRLYGDALISVRLHGHLMRLRHHRGESMSEALHRSLEKAKIAGAIGVDSGRDDVGIAIIDPASIEITEMSWMADGHLHWRKSPPWFP
jgi:hypothetical protein